MIVVALTCFLSSLALELEVAVVVVACVVPVASHSEQSRHCSAGRLQSESDLRRKYQIVKIELVRVK